MEVTRRDLFKFTGLAAAGVVGASALAGCAPKTAAETASLADTGSADAGLPAFLQAPEPITDFADTREYDIVVVGAGESGLSAAHSAVAAGAKVACVQNIGTAQTTGNMGASVDTTKTDEAGIQACVAFLMEKNAYRSNRKLLEAWARNSYEAVTWWADTAAEGGAESKPYDSEREYNGYTYYLHANTYNHLEGAHNDAALAVCDAVAAEGVEFFFNSPAVQLYKEGERVAGVICETEEGNALFKASKGVILASGDCSGNQEMRDYYCPDLRGFKTMSPFRDGMGMMTGIWAGAQMTPVNHSKMVHGGGALTRLELPFLNLDIHGERFMNEVLSFAYLNNLMRGYLEEYDFQNPMAAKFFTIMPANWAEIGEQWTAAHPEEVKFGVGNMKGPSDASSSRARPSPSWRPTSTPTWKLRSGTSTPSTSRPSSRPSRPTTSCARPAPTASSESGPTIWCPSSRDRSSRCPVARTPCRPCSASRPRCSPGASCRSAPTIGRDSAHLRPCSPPPSVSSPHPSSPRLQCRWLQRAPCWEPSASARYSSCSTRPSCL